jgi:cell division protein FtsQ
MLLKKNKKIFLYFFLLFLIGILNNKNIKSFEFIKINQIKVSGLSEKENLEVRENLEEYKIFNLFLLKEFHLEKVMNSNDHVEEFFIFKRYPSSLEVQLKETKYLAYINKDESFFYIGSNGKLIKAKNKKKKLPFIYGNIKLEKFFKFKEIVDKSSFKFVNIKNLFFFPSGRWDIETCSGILLKLPKLDFEKSLNLYNDLLKKDKLNDVNSIDFRQINQVIING